ncbi:MAG: deoxyribonuclease IV [Candidatus Nanohaloarchaeota archaeon QJJ-5]|nr:deoxyribonuclease IV [Candidatus Nanohaloarchaeota archaeon QJJ-5]
MTFNIGAHVSVAGGVTNAIEEQDDIDGTCGQIFAGSPRTWSVASYTDEEGQSFREARSDHEQGPYVIHSTYLVNLATPKDDLFDKSVQCLRDELEAAGQLGVEYVVFHPGSHTGAGVEAGIESIGQGLSDLADVIPDETMVLLENTAGAGTSLGRDLEELQAMIEASSLDLGEDVGICIDTCHAFVAGYDLRTTEGVQELVDDCRRTVGLDTVPVIHLNDSKHPYGSEKDEHAHLGAGEIGDPGMAAIVTHDALTDKAFVLETPVEDGKGYAENIEHARGLRGEH